MKTIDTKMGDWHCSFPSLGKKCAEKENIMVGRIVTPSMMSWDSGAVGIKVSNQLSLK